MGKLMIIIGSVFIVVGLVISYSDKISFLGKLPGDFTFERGNFKFYFPLTTSILISLLISLILLLFNKLKN